MVRPLAFHAFVDVLGPTSCSRNFLLIIYLCFAKNHSDSFLKDSQRSKNFYSEHSE